MPRVAPSNAVIIEVEKKITSLFVHKAMTLLVIIKNEYNTKGVKTGKILVSTFNATNSESSYFCVPIGW